MRNISYLLISAALAVPEMTMLGLPSQGAQGIAHKTNVYDGDWSVLIQTNRGNCPPAFRAGVRIAGGHLIPADQSYQLNGEVNAGGTVRVTVSAGGQSAGGSERLTRNTGSGLWRTQSGECTGQWAAARRV
jgi:hypothetical protein